MTRRFWPVSNDAKSIFFVDTLDSVLSHQTNTSISVVLGLHPTYHRLSATYLYISLSAFLQILCSSKYHNSLYLYVHSMAFFCQLLNWHSMAWEKMQKTILKLLYSGKENVLRGFFSRKQKHCVHNI